MGCGQELGSQGAPAAADAGADKGIAFIKYTTNEEAELCIKKYNDHYILDKWVEVATVAAKRGMGVDSDNTVFIGGIHKDKTTEASLREHFENDTSFPGGRILIDSINIGKGFAYVTFSVF